MEVMYGYKQTEVGVIPEDWDVVSVKTLVENKTLAKPLDGNHGNIHPKSSDYVDHGIPFVMANNFADGQVNLVDCKFITKERADKLQKGFAVSGDVLLTHKGTVGNTAVVGQLATDYIMLTPQVTYYRVTDYNRLNNLFLRHYFDSQPFQSMFISLAGGGTRAYLGIVRQLELPIVQPPIAEQRAIADALSDADALLGGLDRVIAKKRDLKQAAMERLLTGQTRLPGYKGEWELATFDRVFRKLNAKAYQIQTSEYQSTGAFPVVDQGQQTIVGFSDSEDKCFRCPEEGVVIFGDHTCIVKFVDFNFVVGAGGTQILAAKAGQCARFHAFALQYRGIPTTGYNRHFKFLKERLFVSPPHTEQTAIADVVSDMDAELAGLEQRREKTRGLKQAMMQELLTGKTRLV
jgi:type I restriction enzyme S subunit